MSRNGSIAKTGAPHAGVLRYLQQERRKRCEALKAQAEEEARAIEAEFETRKAAILNAGRAEFPALMRSINLSIVGPAKREGDAVTSKKMGEAVERIIDGCRKRLQAFAESESFVSALEPLILETIEYARSLQHLESRGMVKGRMLVAPRHSAACEGVVRNHNLAVTVEPDDSVWGGVELLVGDGVHRIRNTLESRMTKNEASLRAVATTRVRQALTRQGSA